MNTETPPALPADAAPRRPHRWLKRLGWVCIWIVTLAVLAIAVENHLGARAWQAALAETRAAGEPIDAAQIIPPPAADAENFAAIPLFAPLFNEEAPAGPVNILTSRRSGDPEAKAPVEALRLPTVREPGTFRRGQFVDLAVWQRALNVEGEAGTPGAAVLGALHKFEPELDALREAAKRPRSRFPLRYEDSVAAAIPHVGVLMNLARITALRSVAELAEGKVEAAHGDLLLGLAVEEASREEPFLISALVRVAVFEMLLQPLWEGLARRQWNEAQLASLDAALQRPDFIATFQLAMRGERLIFTTQALDALKKDHALIWGLTETLKNPGEGPDLRDRAVRRALGWLIPDGWLDFNKAALSRSYGDLVRATDLNERQFHPQQFELADQAFVREKAHNPYNPRRIFARLAFPAVSASVLRCASAQSSLDLARAAITLERYRLTHGAWPAALADLPAVPRDVIGGGPLHYRLEPSGEFTLYSIGWNERDDGGVTAWKGTAAPGVDWKEGDWVWPAYPHQEVVK
jgi:hypothetical protein